MCWDYESIVLGWGVVECEVLRYIERAMGEEGGEGLGF